MSSRQKLSALG